MGVINQIPEGFLDLIKAKTGGRNPTEIGDQVVPTLPMDQFYFARSISHAFASSVTSAVGDAVSIEVPDGETWFLLAVDVSHTTSAAGNRISFDVELRQLPDAPSPLNAISIFETPQPENSGIAVVHDKVRSKTFLPPIALAPGVLIQANVLDTSTNTTTWSLNVGFYKLTT